ncbi:penicillin-binding transpeptidase domain-containing protein [Streptomyces sp. NPDC049954]|uniref:penicillin-binding transpeptidase domain-containing protein n=1 Tax=Streptomyces sp. NPDC049954 TaxID=3155779 RepID=UPI0034305681
MTRYIRRAAALCLVLLVALLLNATRVQVFRAQSYDDNQANRRTSIARYGQPRGDILVGGSPVTGSRDTGELLRYERTYRQGPLYAPVTGYTSQVFGSTLLERTEDPLLAGSDPALSPFPLWNELTRSRSRGGDVATTIEPGVQQAAFKGLAGRTGAVAAIEPTTGRVLALVSSPSYDPARLSGTSRSVTDAWNRLLADPAQPMLNRAIAHTYPPGSTFKIVTAAAALDAGTVRDVDEPTRSPDPYTLPGSSASLSNEVEGCRNASLRYAFQWSCNTVFAALGVRTGLKDMVRTARDFGFNDKGLRIPFRVAASNFDTSLDRAQLALSAIGQYDTRATPLQMAMVAGAVAGGGSVPQPQLVRRTVTHGGDVVSEPGPRDLYRAMTPYTAARLRELMVDAVERGTGGRAAIPGVQVGGKTGTAQHGVGNEGTPYAWFVSWAQAANAPSPQVAVAVVVEDASADRGDISGGGNAAPIARSVMQAALKAREGERSSGR